MSSKDEYNGTLRMPYTFQFEDGPRMTREPLVHILKDGSVVWVWTSDSGSTVATYRIPADMHEDEIGRGASLSSSNSLVPTDAIKALAERIFPDEPTAVMGVGSEDPPSSLVVAMFPKPYRIMSVVSRFPRWN